MPLILPGKRGGRQRRVNLREHETTKSPLAREALDRIGALHRIKDTIRVNG